MYSHLFVKVSRNEDLLLNDICSTLFVSHTLPEHRPNMINLSAELLNACSTQHKGT